MVLPKLWKELAALDFILFLSYFNTMKEEARELHYTFTVSGMTCASCSRIVERKLKRTEGIAYVSVNLATEKAYVVTDERIDRSVLKEIVESTGYGYRENAPEADSWRKIFEKLL